MIERCPLCHSARLLRGIELKTKFRSVPTRAVAPGGVMGLGEAIGDVRGVACVDCGAIQWEARDLDRLGRLYGEQQAASVRLK